MHFLSIWIEPTDHALSGVPRSLPGDDDRVDPAVAAVRRVTEHVDDAQGTP
jgi:hypothetical protein